MDLWKKGTVQNEKKQGNKGHMTRGRYCKIYKIPPRNLVRPCRKNETPATAKINCSVFSGGEKGKEKDNLKDGGKRPKRF